MDIILTLYSLLQIVDEKTYIYNNTRSVYFNKKFHIRVMGFVFIKSTYCSVLYLEERSYLRPVRLA